MTETVDKALVLEVAGWAKSRAENPSSLEGLTEIEVDVLGTITAKGVIGNGGFDYWYQGTDRLQSLIVAASFDRMGLAAAAQAMRDSLLAFPDATPPPDLGDRQGFLSEHREELEDRFRPLDEVIWDTDYDLAAARYIFGRRRELLAMEPGFGPILQGYETAELTRRARLVTAAAALDPEERAACEQATNHGNLTGALDGAIAAGASRSAGFWRELAAVARALGHDGRAERCDWWSRVADQGAVIVSVEFLPSGDLKDGDRRVHRTGDKVNWSAGAEPAGLFRARRAEFFFPGRGWVMPGERSDAFLVPGDEATPTGTTVVLHHQGEIIGRARVVEIRSPRPA